MPHGGCAPSGDGGRRSGAALASGLEIEGGVVELNRQAEMAHVLPCMAQIPDEPRDTRSAIIAGESRQSCGSEDSVVCERRCQIVKEGVGMANLVKQVRSALTAHSELGVSIAATGYPSDRPQRFRL